MMGIIDWIGGGPRRRRRGKLEMAMCSRGGVDEDSSEVTRRIRGRRLGHLAIGSRQRQETETETEADRDGDGEGSCKAMHRVGEEPWRVLAIAERNEVVAKVTI